MYVCMYTYMYIHIYIYIYIQPAGSTSWRPPRTSSRPGSTGAGAAAPENGIT